METVLNTSAELFRQIGYIVDDEDCMKEVLKYVRKLVEKKKEASVMTREEILEDFKTSLNELKLHNEGKLQFTTLEDFRDELRRERK